MRLGRSLHVPSSLRRRKQVKTKIGYSEIVMVNKEMTLESTDIFQAVRGGK